MSLTEAELLALLDACRRELSLARQSTAELILDILTRIIAATAQVRALFPLHEAEAMDDSPERHDETPSQQEEDEEEGEAGEKRATRLIFLQSGILRTLTAYCADESTPLSLRLSIVSLVFTLAGAEEQFSRFALLGPTTAPTSDPTSSTQSVTRKLIDGLILLAKSPEIEGKSWEAASCLALLLVSLKEKTRKTLMRRTSCYHDVCNVLTSGILTSSDPTVAHRLHEACSMIAAEGEQLSLSDGEGQTIHVTKVVLSRPRDRFGFVWPRGTMVKAEISPAPLMDDGIPLAMETVALKGTIGDEGIQDHRSALCLAVIPFMVVGEITIVSHEETNLSMQIRLLEAKIIALAGASREQALEVIHAFSASGKYLFKIGMYEEAIKSYVAVTKYVDEAIAEAEATGPKASDASALQIEVGSLVAMKRKGESHLSPGVVCDVNGDGTCDVLFDDGGELNDVEISKLQPLAAKLTDTEDLSNLRTEKYRAL